MQPTPEQARAELERRRAARQITPEMARAELERRRASSGDALDQLGRGDDIPATQAARQEPQPQVGNAVSRALGEFADQRAAPGLAGGLISGAARVAQGIARDPVQALIVDPLSAPARAAAGVNDASEAAFEGDFDRAARRGIEGLTAAGETALIAAPGAGVAARSAARAPVGSAQRKATQRLLEADPELAQRATQAKRLQASGQPVTTADLVNRNAQSRLKGAARRDGPAQELAEDAFEPRQAGSADRLAEDVRRAFGVTEDFTTRRKALESARREKSRPLYDRAYATPTRKTEKLAEILERDPVKQALRDADELAAIDGVRLTPEVNTQRLHYARQALDAQIDQYRDNLTGKVQGVRGAKLSRLRRQFNQELRKSNPAFREADDAFSGGMAAQEAMDRGLKAASFRTERQVRQLMDDAIKAGDQEFFELGYAQGLIEKIGRSGSDQANRTLQLLSPEQQKITRAVLGDERGEALLNRIRVENLMARTKNKISPNVGSDTAENVQQSAAFAVALIGDLARGSVDGAASLAARAVGGKKLSERMIKTQREVDEQLIRLATEEPDELLRIIAEIQTPRRSGVPNLTPSAAGIGAAAIESGSRAAPQAPAQPQ